MARKVTKVAGVVVLVTSGLVDAATIYGTIQTERDQPAAGQTIVLSCPWGPPQNSSTDSRGSYHFTMDRPGNCELHIGNGSGTVIFYDEPARYDFKIQGDGSLLRQ